MSLVRPHSPDNRAFARECKDVNINRVYIGSCTGGKTEDFMAAAKVFLALVPDELRSVGLSLYLSIFGVGSFLSSFLISAIQKGTSKDGSDGWFAHLDYFYALLAVLSVVELSALWFFSKSYVYKRTRT
ncbi:hypothetical protein RYX36_017464 [Vicia faba]